MLLVELQWILSSRWGFLIFAVSAVLVLLHPGWWWSARAGHCGMARVVGALGWSTVFAAWLLVAIGIAAVRRRRAQREESRAS